MLFRYQSSLDIISYHDTTFASDIISNVAISFSFALLAYLVIEKPFMNIEALILGKHKATSREIEKIRPLRLWHYWLRRYSESHKYSQLEQENVILEIKEDVVLDDVNGDNIDAHANNSSDEMKRVLWVQISVLCSNISYYYHNLRCCTLTLKRWYRAY
jgi:hypothetical protein